MGNFATHTGNEEMFGVLPNFVPEYAFSVRGVQTSITQIVGRIIIFSIITAFCDN